MIFRGTWGFLTERILLWLQNFQFMELCSTKFVQPKSSFSLFNSEIGKSSLNDFDFDNAKLYVNHYQRGGEE